MSELSAGMMSQGISSSGSRINFYYPYIPAGCNKALNIQRTSSSRQRLGDVTCKLHQGQILYCYRLRNLTGPYFKPAMRNGANTLAIVVHENIHRMFVAGRQILHQQIVTYL